MQEFGKRIGWARGGLIVSAVLLVILGALCFIAPEMMPEAMHTTGLAGTYTTGGILIAVVFGIAGICQLAAFNMAGGSKNLGGWLVLPGIMSLICCIAAIIDPFVGTFTYEWVPAVFIAFLGIMMFLGAVVSGRPAHYKGWVIETLLGLVMIVLAVAIIYNSANTHFIMGISFVVFAVNVLLVPFMGKDMELAA